MIVSAIDDEAAAFYERFGSAVIPETSRCMYLLVAEAEATILAANAAAR